MTIAFRVLIRAQRCAMLQAHMSASTFAYSMKIHPGNGLHAHFFIRAAQHTLLCSGMQYIRNESHLRACAFNLQQTCMVEPRASLTRMTGVAYYHTTSLGGSKGCSRC